MQQERRRKKMNNTTPIQTEAHEKTFQDVYNEKLKAATECNGDSCTIVKHQNQESFEKEEEEQLRNMVKGLTAPAKIKLLRWLDRFEPIDYDAPGCSVREQGV